MTVPVGFYLYPALASWMLNDRFDVVRRTEIVGRDGRVQRDTLPVTFPGVRGVVGPAAPNDMDRTSDLDLSRSTLTAITTFRLQGPSPGKLPDHVMWHGNSYQVLAVNDYSAYGPGFVQATLQMVDAQAQPPDPL